MKKTILLIALMATVVITNAQEPRPPRPPMEHGPRGEYKEKIEMYKVQFFTEKLGLTKNEAELFWPIYESHKKAMKEIMDNRTGDEIQMQEAALNARKKYKNELTPVLKSDERVNEALKIDREFMRKIKDEVMRRIGDERKRRKGFQS